jgi:long-chain fatty acid transport protein
MNAISIGRFLRRLFPVCVLAIALAPSSTFGSAFTIYELGTRAMGMGGAFVAIADDGSALFYNPAGIAFQPGLRLQMDSLVVVGLFRFTPSQTAPGQFVPEKGFNGSVSPKFIPVASLYMTKDINARWTFGFGVFSPFGLSANFTSFQDADPFLTKFPARFAGSRARLESIWFQPTAAYRINESLSIAMGVALVHTHLMIEQSILNPLDDGRVFGEQIAEFIFPGEDPELAGRSIARLLPEGRSRLAGTSQSPGFNAGLLYRHEASQTSFGLMFRSAVTHHLDGRATFAFTDDYTLKPFIGEDTIPDLFPAQDIKGSFTTPATYKVGVASTAFWNSTVAFDFTFQDYHRFRSVPVNFSETVDTATPEELVLEFDFNNSFLVHAGIEKPVWEDTAVRFGYMYDHSPVPDKSTGPLFPDSNRHSFTVGASKRMGNMEMTFFYQAMKFTDRVTNVPENENIFTNGRYDNFAHLGGLGLRINLGSASLDNR